MIDCTLRQTHSAPLLLIIIMFLLRCCLQHDGVYSVECTLGAVYSVECTWWSIFNGTHLVEYT